LALAKEEKRGGKREKESAPYLLSTCWKKKGKKVRRKKKRKEAARSGRGGGGGVFLNSRREKKKKEKKGKRGTRKRKAVPLACFRSPGKKEGEKRKEGREGGSLHLIITIFGRREKENSTFLFQKYREKGEGKGTIRTANIFYRKREGKRVGEGRKGLARYSSILLSRRKKKGGEEWGRREGQERHFIFSLNLQEREGEEGEKVKGEGERAAEGRLTATSSPIYT